MHLSHKCKHARAQCSLSAPALILKTPGTTRALWSGNWERAVYSWRFQRVEKEKKGPIEASLERRLVFWYLYFHWKRKKEKRKKKTRVRRGGVSRGRLSRVFHPPAQAHRPPHHVSVYLGRVFKASEHSVGYVSRGWRLLFHRPPKHEAEEPCERQPLETRGGGRVIQCVCWHDNSEKINTARALLLPKRRTGLKASSAHAGGGEKKNTCRYKGADGGVSAARGEPPSVIPYTPPHVPASRWSHSALLLVLTIGKETGHLYWKGCHGNAARPPLVKCKSQGWRNNGFMERTQLPIQPLSRASVQPLFN